MLKAAFAANNRKKEAHLRLSQVNPSNDDEQDCCFMERK